MPTNGQLECRNRAHNLMSVICATFETHTPKALRSVIPPSNNSLSVSSSHTSWKHTVHTLDMVTLDLLSALRRGPAHALMSVTWATYETRTSKVWDQSSATYRHPHHVCLSACKLSRKRTVHMFDIANCRLDVSSGCRSTGRAHVLVSVETILATHKQGCWDQLCRAYI